MFLGTLRSTMEKHKQLVNIFLSLFLVAITFLSSCTTKESQQAEALQVEEIEGEFKYGIRVDTFQSEEKLIQRNEFLADILQSYGVPYDKVHTLATDYRDQFDFRKIRSGQPYTALQRNDSSRTLEYFIYEKNAVEYVVCTLGDTVNVSMGKKEIETCDYMATGVINSSLYETLNERNLSPTLSLLLADVYAWTVDFYHLQKGDQFKVIYQEQFVEGKSIGVNHIKSALFVHNGKEIYAHHYITPDDTLGGNYYDQEGNNLRKAFLKSPLKFGGRLTSRYSGRRFHPVQKRYKAHLGTDYAAPTGTPILATGDGVVIERAYKKHNGNYIKIRHNGTYTTQYLHMSKFNSNVKVGTNVKQGQTIGYVGSTGLATGPHVCYRFWKDGAQVDPFREELPPSKPIKEEFKSDFLLAFDIVKQELDQLKYPEPKKEAEFNESLAIGTNEPSE